ncbi:hypothetical protein Tco_0751767 [Tanacetum coccineum]|uniref:Uncharacterized protein n=1 Tax=Tanacetum coccineum TaxID=301880 RepID=A0ABQ4Z6K7_9ASTR
MENNNSSPHNCVEVIDGAASVQRKTANSFASVLHNQSLTKQVVKIMELRNNDVVDGANVAITMEAVEVSSRFANTLYGYFIGKRLAFPLFDSKDELGKRRQNLRDTWACCFRCKDKFAPGHRCKLATFSLLEISNDNEQLEDREVEANENEYAEGINQQDMLKYLFMPSLARLREQL